MPRRDVVLTDHQEAMVEKLVRSGRYTDASEVFGDALRLIERRESIDHTKLLALRAAAQIGVDAIDRGDFKEFADVDDMIAYLTKATEDILRDEGGEV